MPLRGVAVKAWGVQEAAAVTDSHGEAHFVDLLPGEYTIVATLGGYNDYHSINVPVATGTTVPLRIFMSIQGAARQVDTRIDAPVVDTRARTASTAVFLAELQRVPWNRDPWTVVQTVPAAHALDGRLSKSFATSGLHVYALHVDLDVFNVFNRSIVLARGYDLSRPDFNRVTVIINPRTVRLGFRVSF